MTAVALLPLVVWIAAVVAVALVGARTADEAEQLRAELVRLGQLRPLLAEVGDRGQRLRASIARLQR